MSDLPPGNVVNLFPGRGPGGGDPAGPRPAAPPAAPPAPPPIAIGAGGAGLPVPTPAPMMPAGPMPGGPMGAPGMMINPAFLQWQQINQMLEAERRQRTGQFLAACQLIREDVATGYVIDIEADSTVAADEQAEKQARTEFLTSILPMLQLLIPQAQ